MQLLGDNSAVVEICTGIVWWGDPVWMLNIHQIHSVAPLLSWTAGRNYNKLVG